MKRVCESVWEKIKNRGRGEKNIWKIRISKLLATHFIDRKKNKCLSVLVP